MANKKLIFWFFLFCLSFGFAVLFAEAALQIHESHHKAIQDARKELFRISPFLQIEPRPNAKYHVNEDTFRGDPVSEDPETYRIFTLGGSTTFSEALDYKETYPAKLEDRLAAHYRQAKIQVENAACDWYSTQHSIIRYLFKVRQYQANLIIVKHAINDLFRGFVPEAYSRPGDVFQPDYSHYLGPIAGFAQEKETHPFFRFLLLGKTCAAHCQDKFFRYGS